MCYKEEGKQPKTYAEIFIKLSELEHQLSEIGKIESNKPNSIEELAGSLGNILKVGELRYQIDILKWVLAIEN